MRLISAESLVQIQSPPPNKHFVVDILINGFIFIFSRADSINGSRNGGRKASRNFSRAGK